MAIPFYEPRQQHHTNECDQVDGNFPPAPGSQSMSVPPASTNMISSIAQPTHGTIVPTAVVNINALVTTTNPTVASLAASSSTADANLTTNIFASTPPANATNSNAVTATFSYPPNTPIATTASLATQTTATEFPTTASSTTAPSTVDPLPWKLLAVSMCKALKQYYQQNGASGPFTTAVIEILPSGVSAAQE